MPDSDLSPRAAALLATYRRVREAQAAASAGAAAVPPAARLEALLDDARGRLAALVEAGPNRAAFACGRGCGWCCHQPVLITMPEAIAIAAWLADTLDAGELAQARAIVDQRVEAVRRCSSSADYLRERLPCAFLAADGSCGVHQARPLICRSYHSLSAEACAAKHRDRAAPNPPIDGVSHMAGNGVVHGLDDALREAGLDAGLFELHHAVQRALAEPDAAARWGAGARLSAGLPGRPGRSAEPTAAELPR